MVEVRESSVVISLAGDDDVTGWSLDDISCDDDKGSMEWLVTGVVDGGEDDASGEETSEVSEDVVEGSISLVVLKELTGDSWLVPEVECCSVKLSPDVESEVSVGWVVVLSGGEDDESIDIGLDGALEEDVGVSYWEDAVEVPSWDGDSSAVEVDGPLSSWIKAYSSVRDWYCEVVSASDSPVSEETKGEAFGSSDDSTVGLGLLVSLVDGWTAGVDKVVECTVCEEDAGSASLLKSAAGVEEASLVVDSKVLDIAGVSLGDEVAETAFAFWLEEECSFSNDEESTEVDWVESVPDVAEEIPPEASESRFDESSVDWMADCCVDTLLAGLLDDEMLVSDTDGVDTVYIGELEVPESSLSVLVVKGAVLWVSLCTLELWAWFVGLLAVEPGELSIVLCALDIWSTSEDGSPFVVDIRINMRSRSCFSRQFCNILHLPYSTFELLTNNLSQ